MLGKKEIDSIRYYIKKGESINVGEVMYDGEWVKLELGVFIKKDICPSGNIIKEYRSWFHILDDGKAYYRICKENGEEIMSYSPLNSVEFFELQKEESYNILADKKVIIFNRNNINKNVAFEMSNSQFLSVERYFNSLNMINKPEQFEYTNHIINKYDYDAFEELIFRLLVKQGYYDEVIRPTQNRKNKYGIDVMAYKHEGNDKGKHLFECKNVEIFPAQIDKLHKTLIQEKAFKGHIVGTRGISDTAKEKAEELGIQVLTIGEQLELLKKYGLIYPLKPTELIREEKKDKYNFVLYCKEKSTALEKNAIKRYNQISRNFIKLLYNQIYEWMFWIENDMIQKHKVLEFYHDLCNIPKQYLTKKFNYYDISEQIDYTKKQCKLWLDKE